MAHAIPDHHRPLVRSPAATETQFEPEEHWLTASSHSLATLTFTVGLLADMFLSQTLFRIKNILGVTSAPMEILISILYWGLRAIDPALVLPDWAAPLPLSSDMSFHLVPALVLALDLLFFSPPWTISFVPAAALSSLLAGAYWLWVEACYARNGFYPYPIFQQLEPAQRAGLFAASAVTFTASTFGLKRVQAWIAPRERPGSVQGNGIKKR